MPKQRLGINIDHVATLRNARSRKTDAEPDILRAALAAIKGGADGITFHLREDRRHMLDDDVLRLRRALKKPTNLEMAATEEMMEIALALKPHAVCIVPEKRQEVTTEGGLNVTKGGKKLGHIINRLAAAGIKVSLFIDPDPEQILAAWTSGAAAIEFHTGAYANLAAKSGKTATGKAPKTMNAAQKKELKRIQWGATQASKLGLEVHAGHGLNYENVEPIARIPEIVELNIGHSLMGEALFVGIPAAVQKMKRLMTKCR